MMNCGMFVLHRAAYDEKLTTNVKQRLSKVLSAQGLDAERLSDYTNST